MALREIARGEWETLLAGLGRDYSGRPVSVETSCWETCSVYQRARNLPLRELRIDALDRPDETAIALTVGDSAASAFTHTIVRPLRILFETAAHGESHRLRVESADGIVTSVLLAVG